MRGTWAALRDPQWWAPRIVGLSFVVAAATRLARPAPLRPHARRAFTIVELLIVVGIIGLLIGIALPALKHARVKAAEARNLAIHRSLISALLSYSIDHDGRFPFLGTPGDPMAPVVAWGYPSEYSFFGGQSFLWLCTLVPEYFDLRNEQVDVALANPFGVPHPGLPNAPPEVFQTAFLLTQTAFAQPRFWSPAQEPLPELCTPTRWKDVQFPAMKGITLDRHLVTLMELSDHVGLVSVGMGDGSASIRPATPPGWEDRVVARPYGAWPTLIMATRDGLAGRDY